MTVLDKVTEQELGTCVHCLATVTVPMIPSLESFLAFEAKGLCPGCQSLG